MALNKYYGRPFITEVPMPQREIVPPSKLEKPLSQTKVALVTDGGLVPQGNPDRMVPVNSVKLAVCSIRGKASCMRWATPRFRPRPSSSSARVWWKKRCICWKNSPGKGDKAAFRHKRRAAFLPPKRMGFGA